MNIARLNPRRLKSPAEIVEALDAITAEIDRLRALQDEVQKRDAELKSEAFARAMARTNMTLEDTGASSYEEMFRQMMADAMAYRASQNAAPKADDEPAKVSDSVVEDEDDADDDDADDETGFGSIF